MVGLFSCAPLAGRPRTVTASALARSPVSWREPLTSREDQPEFLNQARPCGLHRLLFALDLRKVAPIAGVAVEPLGLGLAGEEHGTA